MRFSLIFGSLLFLSQSLNAQTVYSEDFNSYPNGTTTGTGSSWTSVCGGCLSGDHFEVRSGVFEGNDVNDFSTWQTQSIDISSCAITEFSLDAIEVGDHEGPGCSCGVNIDYFDVSYSVDGGAFTIIEDWNGDGEPGHTLTGDSNNGSFTDADWGSTTITQGGISGSTLVIRVVVRNTAGTERLQLDNVIVSCTSGLPVSLVKFDGEATTEGNMLMWSTATEKDNRHFQIEYSEDAVNFETVGTIDGQGTTTQNTDYAYLHRTATNTAYYRLKQVDFDGTATSTETISVVRMEQAIAPSPNPFNDHLQVHVPDDAIVTVQNPEGMIVFQKFLESGTHNLGYQLEQFSDGLYLLTIESSGNKEVHRIVKSR